MSISTCTQGIITHSGRSRRKIQTQADHLHGTDRTTYELNFAGEIEKTITHHSGPNSNSVVTEKCFCYDHKSRLSRLTQSINNEPEIILAKYEYDELGRQEKKLLYSDNGAQSYLQTVNQSYNIRGWLTGINDSATVESGDLPDLFQMCLHPDG